VQHPSAIRHVLSRGDHLEPTFCGDTDRRLSMDSASYDARDERTPPDELP
jgi:hypothetical protein